MGMDSSLLQLRSKAKIRDGTIASHVIRVKRGLLETWINDRPLLISRRISMSKERYKNFSTFPNQPSFIWCPSNQKQNLILEKRLERFKCAWLGTGCKDRRVSSSRIAARTASTFCANNLEKASALSSKPIRDLAI